MTTNHPSEVKCCEKCRHLGLPEAFGNPHSNCPCHKESPVSQTVDGLPSGEGVSKSRKLAQTLLGGIQYGDGRDNPEWRLKVMNGAEAYIDDFLKDTLSTLVKEMEGMKKQRTSDRQLIHQDHTVEYIKYYESDSDPAFNQGISAAQKIVKKMV